MLEVNRRLFGCRARCRSHGQSPTTRNIE
jgi:hypothetical protein